MKKNNNKKTASIQKALKAVDLKKLQLKKVIGGVVGILARDS